jgi:two-component system, cell cycle response regulator DivK
MIGMMPKTILIVEDNVLNLKLFGAFLVHQGYRTIHSTDGLDIFQIMREQRPDLILMDIQLPEILGTEIARQLKAEPDLCRVPIIAVTACAMRGDEERIRSSGCDEFLSKPVQLNDLLAAVRRYAPLSLDGVRDEYCDK